MNSTFAPKKYCKINGVMKLNPEYKAWKDAQANDTTALPATTVVKSAEALLIVSSMEDYTKMNEDLEQDIPLSESTNDTFEMLQEPEIALEAGMQPDDMIDQLGRMLEKYEIPIGLANKLWMIDDYQSLEFIVDDSDGMRLNTDSIDKKTRKPMSRWVEAQQRLKEMIEVVAYVPFEQIGIEFLNRKDRISLTRQGRTPQQFLDAAYREIDAVFARDPSGTTPALEKLQESFLRGQGVNIAYYFFGDGKPNGGQQAIDEIVKILRNRPDPEQNPMTFLSCTDEDEAVEWMKDAAEIAPNCSELDDFNNESQVVCKNQGAALPYSKGFHLICQLVAAMNPDDLDTMDESESICFTKSVLDNLLGIVTNNASYEYYCDSYEKAKREREVEIHERNRQPSRWDQWNLRQLQ